MLLSLVFNIPKALRYFGACGVQVKVHSRLSFTVRCFNNNCSNSSSSNNNNNDNDNDNDNTSELYSKVSFVCFT